MGEIDPDIKQMLDKFKNLDLLYEAAACPNRDIREKIKNPWAVGMAQAIKTTGDKPPLKKSTIKKAHEIARSIDEEFVKEKWGKPTEVSPREKGKYEGKTKAELLKSYRALKARGPHKKGSSEYGRMRELAFAIRAKSGWGKVKEE